MSLDKQERCQINEIEEFVRDVDYRTGDEENKCVLPPRLRGLSYTRSGYSVSFIVN